jgi:hypothetical protein
MPYIGNTPTTQSFSSGTDYFNGNASQTAFTLSRPVASINDVQVVVNNVAQAPNSGYTISGNTLTFDAAPSIGTNNVYVRYLSTTTQTIVPGQGTVGTAQLAGGVTVSFADGSAAAPSITNIGDTNTGMFFPAADTIAFTEGGTEAMRLTDTGLLQFNSGYGSVATAYGCRAWVNFNGTGTVAIRASGNVTSITDNGAGNFTINFTTALPDTNYIAVASSGNFSGSGATNRLTSCNLFNTGNVTMFAYTTSNVQSDETLNCVAVFR